MMNIRSQIAIETCALPWAGVGRQKDQQLGKPARSMATHAVPGCALMGSGMMSVAHVTIEDLVEVSGLCCSLKPC